MLKLERLQRKKAGKNLYNIKQYYVPNEGGISLKKPKTTATQVEFIKEHV